MNNSFPVLPSWLTSLLAQRAIGVDIPPIKDLNQAWQEIINAIRANECRSVHIPQNAYRIGNSVVISAPQIRSEDLFPMENNLHIVQTFVMIWHDEHSDPHTHNSHVISYIIEGHGYLNHWPQGMDKEKQTLSLKAGDLLVVPMDVWHHLNCEPDQTMITSGLEIAAGQELYYQKNQYEEQTKKQP